MRVLVTGAGGFIGSSTVEEGLRLGWEIVGVDNFSDYYDPNQKRRNIEQSLGDANFSLVERDLAVDRLDDLVEGVDAVMHLAGQPGVRGSWELFPTHVSANIMATQRLLEAMRSAPTKRLVFASSSSVYGNATSYPVSEDDQLVPVSPYGVSKLAAERLCVAYASQFQCNTVSLRYFTVYGPRQRPDMAIERLIRCALDGTTFELFGDGTQVRDFTFVGDVVRANLLGIEADVEPGVVINISGGAAASMNEVIETVESATGTRIAIDRTSTIPGDVHRTGGSVARAESKLGWKPIVSLAEGIAKQVQWARARSAGKER